MKTQLNARISAATREKLDALTVLYGTQAEALAVAIELLHTRETVYGGRYEKTNCQDKRTATRSDRKCQRLVLRK